MALQWRRGLLPSKYSRKPQSHLLPAIASDTDVWSPIFLDAMKELDKTPRLRKEWPPRLDIRKAANWDDVQAKLDLARKNYDADQIWHNMQQVEKSKERQQHTLDARSDRGQQATRKVLSPELESRLSRVVELLLHVCCLWFDYAHVVISVSPICGKACRQAGDARKTGYGVLHDLPELVARAESYFTMFLRDQDILNWAIKLTIVVLKVSECAILFCTERQEFEIVKRAYSSILKGGEYQKALQQSLAELKSTAKKFVSQAKIMLGGKQGRDEIQRLGSMLNATLGLDIHEAIDNSADVDHAEICRAEQTCISIESIQFQALLLVPV